MAAQVYKVEGMSCGHCEAAVTEGLSALGGLSEIAVSAEEGTATFDNDGTVGDEQIIAAIDEAGFDAARA